MHEKSNNQFLETKQKKAQKPIATRIINHAASLTKAPINTSLTAQPTIPAELETKNNHI